MAQVNGTGFGEAVFGDLVNELVIDEVSTGDVAGESHRCVRPRWARPAEPDPRIAFRDPKYKLDWFQKESREVIRCRESLILAAPTSAGKTTVAEDAIKAALDDSDDSKVVMTTPIKALSNQKYGDLLKLEWLAPGQVCLITGDTNINRPEQARVIVMTTEILRGVLYARQGGECMSEVRTVIFDEFHYLGDVSRGHVWEECIVWLPPKVNIVGLSATVQNTLELAGWMAQNRQGPCHIVTQLCRPVPLEHHMFSCPAKKMFDVLDKNGIYYKDAVKGMNAKLKRANDDELPPLKERGEDLRRFVEIAMNERKIPLIVFSFSQTRCTELARMMAEHVVLDPQNGAQQQVKNRVKSDLSKLIKHQEDRNMDCIREICDFLLPRGIGVHHGGLLPFIRELTEDLFEQGLIRILFATETLGMGVNLPSKSVCFNWEHGREFMKFDGEGVRKVKHSEYIQMCGRAGRRGKDKEGHVYNLIGTKVDEKWMEKLCKGQAEPVESNFTLRFGSLLSCLSYSQATVEMLLQKSFGQFQTKSVNPKYQEEAEQKISICRALNWLDEGMSLTDKGRAARSVQACDDEVLAASLLLEGDFRDFTGDDIVAFLTTLVNDSETDSEVDFQVGKVGLIKLREASERRQKILEALSGGTRKAESRIAAARRSSGLCEAVLAWQEGASFGRVLSLSKNCSEGHLARVLRRTRTLLESFMEALKLYKAPYPDGFATLLEDASKRLKRDEWAIPWLDSLLVAKLHCPDALKLEAEIEDRPNPHEVGSTIFLKPSEIAFSHCSASFFFRGKRGPKLNIAYTLLQLLLGDLSVEKLAESLKVYWFKNRLYTLANRRLFVFRLYQQWCEGRWNKEVKIPVIIASEQDAEDWKWDRKFTSGLWSGHAAKVRHTGDLIGEAANNTSFTFGIKFAKHPRKLVSLLHTLAQAKASDAVICPPRWFKPWFWVQKDLSSRYRDDDNRGLRTWQYFAGYSPPNEQAPELSFRSSQEGAESSDAQFSQRETEADDQDDDNEGAADEDEEEEDETNGEREFDPDDTDDEDDEAPIPDAQVGFAKLKKEVESMQANDQKQREQAFFESARFQRENGTQLEESNQEEEVLLMKQQVHAIDPRHLCNYILQRSLDGQSECFVEKEASKEDLPSCVRKIELPMPIPEVHDDINEYCNSFALPLLEETRSEVRTAVSAECWDEDFVRPCTVDNSEAISEEQRMKMGLITPLPRTLWGCKKLVVQWEGMGTWRDRNILCRTAPYQLVLLYMEGSLTFPDQLSKDVVSGVEGSHQLGLLFKDTDKLPVVATFAPLDDFDDDDEEGTEYADVYDEDEEVDDDSCSVLSMIPDSSETSSSSSASPPKPWKGRRLQEPEEEQRQQLQQQKHKHKNKKVLRLQEQQRESPHAASQPLALRDACFKNHQLAVRGRRDCRMRIAFLDANLVTAYRIAEAIATPLDHLTCFWRRDVAGLVQDTEEQDEDDLDYTKVSAAACQSMEDTAGQQRREEVLRAIKEKGLNEGQMKSARRAFCLKEGVVGIQGPPGTGKTEFLAAFLEIALRFRSRSLVCTPSNAALREIVVRLLRRRVQRMQKTAEGEEKLQRQEQQREEQQRSLLQREQQREREELELELQHQKQQGQQQQGQEGEQQQQQEQGQQQQQQQLQQLALPAAPLSRQEEEEPDDVVALEEDEGLDCNILSLPPSGSVVLESPEASMREVFHPSKIAIVASETRADIQWFGADGRSEVFIDHRKKRIKRKAKNYIQVAPVPALLKPGLRERPPWHLPKNALTPIETLLQEPLEALEAAKMSGGTALVECWEKVLKSIEDDLQCLEDDIPEDGAEMYPPRHRLNKREEATENYMLKTFNHMIKFRNALRSLRGVVDAFLKELKCQELELDRAMRDTIPKVLATSTKATPRPKARAPPPPQNLGSPSSSIAASSTRAASSTTTSSSAGAAASSTATPRPKARAPPPPKNLESPSSSTAASSTRAASSTTTSSSAGTAASSTANISPLTKVPFETIARAMRRAADGDPIDLLRLFYLKTHDDREMAMLDAEQKAEMLEKKQADLKRNKRHLWRATHPDKVEEHWKRVANSVCQELNKAWEAVEKAVLGKHHERASAAPQTAEQAENGGKNDSDADAETTYVPPRDEVHEIYTRTIAQEFLNELQEAFKGVQETATRVRFSNSMVMKNALLRHCVLIFCTLTVGGRDIIRAQEAPSVLIDEAGQSHEASSLVVLRATVEKLILVGDQKQLPAVVKADFAKAANYQRSLFERLESNGHKMELLNTQYRMHPDILAFSNSAFYGNRVMTAQSVLDRSPTQKYDVEKEKDFQWRYRFGHFRIFDTTRCDLTEDAEKEGFSTKNSKEANCVFDTLNRFYNECRPSDDLTIGIVTPYKAQVRYFDRIVQATQSRFMDWLRPRCVVKSTESFQGGERDIIIFSAVRSIKDKENEAPLFLNDPNRMNVALTRGKLNVWIFAHLDFMERKSLQLRRFQPLFGGSLPIRVRDGEVDVHWVDEKLAEPSVVCRKWTVREVAGKKVEGHNAKQLLDQAWEKQEPFDVLFDTKIWHQLAEFCRERGWIVDAVVPPSQEAERPGFRQPVLSVSCTKTGGKAIGMQWKVNEGERNHVEGYRAETRKVPSVLAIRDGGLLDQANKDCSGPVVEEGFYIWEVNHEDPIDRSKEVLSNLSKLQDGDKVELIFCKHARGSRHADEVQRPTSSGKVVMRADDLCGLWRNSFEYVKRVARVMPSEDGDPDGDRYACPGCQKALNSEEALWGHLTSVTKQPEKHPTTEDVDRWYWNSEETPSYATGTHPQMESISEAGNPAWLSNLQALWRKPWEHVRSKACVDEGNNVYRCPGCRERFTSMDDFWGHLWHPPEDGRHPTAQDRHNWVEGHGEDEGSADEGGEEEEQQHQHQHHQQNHHYQQQQQYHHQHQQQDQPQQQQQHSEEVGILVSSGFEDLTSLWQKSWDEILEFAGSGEGSDCYECPACLRNFSSLHDFWDHLWDFRASGSHPKAEDLNRWGGGQEGQEEESSELLGDGANYLRLHQQMGSASSSSSRSLAPPSSSSTSLRETTVWSRPWVEVAQESQRLAQQYGQGNYQCPGCSKFFGEEFHFYTHVSEKRNANHPTAQDLARYNEEWERSQGF